jgi:hypothetical protein
MADAVADGSSRVMCFTMHPYIMGVPHRSKHLRRILEHVCNRADAVVWTGEQILEWYKSVRPKGGWPPVRPHKRAANGGAKARSSARK